MSEPSQPTQNPKTPQDIDEQILTDSNNLDRVMDIPLTISVELGRSKVPISDLLQFSQGSVIELTKLAGEPLDVLVHGKLVARGEAVVVNDQFGIRLTDIVSPTERIQSLVR